ncbi:MAG: rod shape-determining protein MreC [Deltaproteobacteria bacterium]|nr:rod shape-determining protein MreC [Deltaproteobacteria bacterium]
MDNQRKYAFLGILTAMICLLAFYIYRHRQGRTGRIDNFLISATGQLQKHSFYLLRGSRTLVDHYVLLVNARKRNEELEKEVVFLRSKLASLQEADVENLRLKEALHFKGQLKQPLMSASVIAHDVSSDYFGIRIDRGSKDGVQMGQGVISPTGLVGRIQRVAPDYSVVLTLLDPTSNIDVVVQRSRARGILSGQAKQLTCKLKYLDKLEDVAVNDTVISSGFGSIFPEGLLVGYISAVIPSPNGVLQTVTVKSAVDIYRLEEVFVVFPPTEPEKTS